MRCSWISSQNASTSKRGIVTSAAPALSALLATTENPTAWKNGATASMRSSGPRVNAACCCSAFATHARWVSMTPLGSPLVPLE